MVMRSNRTLFACVQLAQAFRQGNINAPRGNIDAAANVQGQRQEQLARRGLNLQQRSARRACSREKHITHCAENARSPFRCAGGRSEFRGFRRNFEYRAADQIADEILAVRKHHTVGQGNQHLQSAQLLRVVNRGATFEMKYAMLRVIAIHPEVFQRGGARLFHTAAQIHLSQGTESHGKVGEQLGQDFALVSARPQDARDQHPFLVFVGGLQSSRISRVKRLRSFIPAAPSSVRMALAVRPWRPITLPRSSGWTRNSRTVTWEPSTALTWTPSG